MNEPTPHLPRPLQRPAFWSMFAIASFAAGLWANGTPRFWSIIGSLPQPIVHLFNWATLWLAKPFLVESVAEAEEQLALYQAIVICAAMLGLAWFTARRICSRVTHSCHGSSA